MKKRILFLSFVLVVLALGAQVYAASILDIKFPIAELGNCADQTACKAYCDDSSRLDECVQFGETHGLLDKNEVKKAKEFAGQTGPGGCRGANECRAYCEDSEHQKECLEFGKRNGLISDQRAEAAEQVLARGGPGGCKNESECKTYCEDSTHIDECLAFAEKHGFVNKEDAARIKKAGFTTGPGGCKGEQCKTYCDGPEHGEECIEFAEKNGFMSREDAGRAKKLAGKPGPGGCRGEECKAYCKDTAHIDECTQFALDNGFISREEAERAKKFKRTFEEEGGPGGCKGEQCRQYCQDPIHSEECFKFAKEKGFIKPEEEQQFEAGKKIRQKMQEAGGPGGCKSEDECRNYCSDPSRVEECVAFGATHGGIPEEKVRKMLKEFQENRFEARAQINGEFQSPEDFHILEGAGQKKFQEFRVLEEQFRGQKFSGGGPGFSGFGQAQGNGGPGGEFGQGKVPGGTFVGPGGCTSPNECIKYCAEHKEECFGGNHSQSGQEGQKQGGRGEQCCPAPGGVPPKLRDNLIHEFKPGEELPQNFRELPSEERGKLFKERFGPPPGEPPRQRPGDGGSGTFPQGQQGQFPGRPGQSEGSREFPGKPGEFPGRPGQTEGSRESPGKPEAVPGKGEFRGTLPGSGQFPARPEGTSSHPPEVNLQKQPAPNTFQSQPSGGTFTPSPSTPPSPLPSGSFEQKQLAPPLPPSGETFSPPPTGTFESSPPSSQPPPPPPPSSSAKPGFFASIIDFMGTR